MVRIPFSRFAPWLLLAALFAVPARAERFLIHREDDAIVVVGPEGRETLRYQIALPKTSRPAGESAGYFHPLSTPAGRVVTDVAPPDHPHHRGVFLGFVELHGARDADFWGWGAHAPVTNRSIVNRKVRNLTSTAHGARFVAENDWMADGTVIVREQLDARITRQGKANILDLAYVLAPTTDTTLSRWAFGGFAVRLNRGAKLAAIAPEGPAAFPPPVHTNPDANWPARPWYAYRMDFPDGGTAFAGVRSSDDNPPTTWHNAASISLLNPAVTAPAELTVKQGKTLVLRYRVVAADDALPPHVLD
jgi:hypothetical protein